MDNKPILLLQTGNTPDPINHRCGNFDAMFVTAAKLQNLPHHIINVINGETPAPPSHYATIIITGSHSMITDREPWSLQTAAWLRDAFTQSVPIFGVCYGHQLLANTLGGKVDYHPNGPEIGPFQVTLTEEGLNDPLLAGFPHTFPAHMAHSQTVLELPPGAKALASSKHDPHQIIRYNEHTLSVQFHPEFGAKEMQAYLEYETTRNNRSGPKPDANNCGTVPWPCVLLQRFVLASARITQEL